MIDLYAIIQRILEYFLENDKVKMRKNFCSSIKDLLFFLQQYMIQKEYNFSIEKKIKLLKKINELIAKTRDLKEGKEENDFVENVKSILSILDSSSSKDKNFFNIKGFIFALIHEIPNKINDFYYSIFCCEDKKTPKNIMKIKGKMLLLLTLNLILFVIKKQKIHY